MVYFKQSFPLWADINLYDLLPTEELHCLPKLVHKTDTRRQRRLNDARTAIAADAKFGRQI